MVYVQLSQRWILEYLEESNADIFCLQEIKLQEGQIDLNVEGYYTYWNYAVKKDIQGRLFFRKKNRFLLLMV